MTTNINNLPELSKNNVLCQFAHLFDVTPMHVIERNNSQFMSDIRHLYCKLRCDKHGLTYFETGREIGRHHTTVMYAVMRINSLISLNDKRIVAMWNKVKDVVKSEG